MTTREKYAQALERMRDAQAEKHIYAQPQKMDADVRFKFGFDSLTPIVLDLVEALFKAKVYALNPDETANYNEVAEVCEVALEKLREQLKVSDGK